MGGPAIGLVLLLVLLAVACIPFGLFLLLLGIRGRRTGDSPTCARCNFDLAGISTQPGTKCPECGVVLDGKVATGRRHRRVGPILIGTLMLLTSLGIVIGALASGGWTRLNPYKPAFMLKAEIAMDGGLRDPAIREFNARLGMPGQLSQSTISSLVDDALALQADESRTWIPLWGDFVENAHTKGRLSDAQWRSYITTALKPRFDVTTRITQGDSISSDLKIGPGRVSQSFQMQVVSKVDELTIDGKPMKLDLPEMPTVSSALTSSGSAWQSKKIDAKDVAPGEQQLVARVTASLKDDPSVQRVETIKYTIRILSSGEPSHKKFVDAAMRDKVTQSIRMDYLEMTRAADGKASTNYSITFTDFPVDAAFDVILKLKTDDGTTREIVVGSVNSRRMPDSGQFGHAGGGDVAIDEPALRRISTAGTLDVELRPSLEVAKSQTNLFEIWGESVMLTTKPKITFPDPATK